MGINVADAGKNECDQRIGPVTRSSMEELDDWMVDTSAVEVSTTETRRLSVYPLEQLIRSDEKKDLLLMFKLYIEFNCVKNKVELYSTHLISLSNKK